MNDSGDEPAPGPELESGRAILEDPIAEARRLIARAAEAGIPLRTIGGIGVWLRAPSLALADPPRTFHDLDLAASRRKTRETAAFLETEGYEPHRRFNTLAGGVRLLFHDPVHGRRVDVFLDRLEMCHTLEFGGHLTDEPETLGLADLLLSKLQIVKLSERDVVDLAALLADHRLTNGRAGAGIDLSRVLAVCANDWGWWRTVTGNLRRLQALWSDGSASIGPDTAMARMRAEELLRALEDVPKGIRWKARAVLGERVTWYQEPEEVR